MHYSEKNLPFGGVGESGMGAYHGKERENRVQSSNLLVTFFGDKTPFLAIFTPYTLHVKEFVTPVKPDFIPRPIFDQKSCENAPFLPKMKIGQKWRFIPKKCCWKVLA